MSIDKFKNIINRLGKIESSKDISARDCAIQWAEANEEIEDITYELDSQRYMYISGGNVSNNWCGLIDWIDNSDKKASEISLNQDKFY